MRARREKKMVRHSKGKGRLCRLLIAMMVIVAVCFMEEPVWARSPIPGQFRVLFYSENPKQFYFKSSQVTRDGFDESQTVGGGGFKLYNVPIAVNTYEDALVYANEANRMYCVEWAGPLQFLTKKNNVGGGEEDYYFQTDAVSRALESTFGVTDADWEKAARALSYAEVIGLDPLYRQNLVYFSLKQAIFSPEICIPESVEMTYAEIEQQNAHLSPEYAMANTQSDMVSESVLATMRIATRPEVKTMTVTAPGEYPFPLPSGYAIAGMVGESLSEGLHLDEELANGLTRETLQSLSEPYQPTFVIDEAAEEGIYVFQISRPDLRAKPSWATYGTSTDPQRSGQWLATFDHEVTWVTDTFTVHYEEECEGKTVLQFNQVCAPQITTNSTANGGTMTSEQTGGNHVLSGGAQSMNGGTTNVSGGPQTQEQTLSSNQAQGDLLDGSGHLEEEKTEETEPQENAKQDEDDTLTPKEDTDPTTSDEKNRASDASINPPTLGKTADGSDEGDGGGAQPTFRAKSKATSSVKSPQTGDTFRVLFWGSIAIGAVLALIGIEVHIRRVKRSH